MGVYHYPIVKQLIGGLVENPYRNGVGAWEGVVLHYTANDTDTAQGEANYQAAHWQNAFVHEYIDWRQIIQTANPQYGAYGAGPKANPRFVHLELCSAQTADQFAQSVDMWCERAAEYLASRKLGVTPAQADGSGTLWRHSDVTKILGGTDHMDPDAYLARWGMPWEDVVARVKLYYDGLIAPSGEPNAPDPKPLPTPAPEIPKTPIFGKAVATVEQMRAYLKAKNSDAPDYAQLYLDLGAKYGIAGDIAFCQSIKETGAWRFGGQVSPTQNNFCGLGATNGGAAGAVFNTQSDGIEAQMQHLYGYATAGDLPGGAAVLDPRFDILAKAGKRGVAPCWEDLNGKWAVPGTTYGQDIVRMCREMCAVEVPKELSEAEVAIKFVQDNGLIRGDETGFNASGTITREQLAVVLHRFAKKYFGA